MIRSQLRKLRSKSSQPLRLYQTKAGAVFGYNPRNWDEESVPLPEDVRRSRNEQANLFRFVSAHRQNGYKYAKLNPVAGSGGEPVNPAELDPSYYSIRAEDTINPAGLVSAPTGTVSELAEVLSGLYCGSTAIEAEYIEDGAEKEWLYARYEEVKQSPLSGLERTELAAEMLKSQTFDNFLATKFSNVKRYGGEGAEAMVGFFVELLRKAEADGVKDVVFGMAHRGRLNLMTG